MTPAADFILVLHAGFVLFVVGGLAAIWAGLAAIAFVVVESLLGYMCPLTVWEDALRGTASDKGFIARWIHAWLFWNWPPWVFTALYTAFGAAVAWTWWRFPPRRRS